MQLYDPFHIRMTTLAHLLFQRWEFLTKLYLNSDHKQARNVVTWGAISASVLYTCTYILSISPILNIYGLKIFRNPVYYTSNQLTCVRAVIM